VFYKQNKKPVMFVGEDIILPHAYGFREDDPNGSPISLQAGG
jgi:hypothetical protein